MIKDDFNLKSGQVLEVTGDTFPYTPKGTICVYDYLNNEYCLLINNEHAYLSDMQSVMKHCELSTKAVDFDYKEILVNDRKQWFINQINELKKICKQ